MLLLCAPFPVSCPEPCTPIHTAILFLLLLPPLCIVISHALEAAPVGVGVGVGSRAGTFRGPSDRSLNGAGRSRR